MKTHIKRSKIIFSLLSPFLTHYMFTYSNRSCQGLNSFRDTHFCYFFSHEVSCFSPRLISSSRAKFHLHHALFVMQHWCEERSVGEAEEIWVLKHSLELIPQIQPLFSYCVCVKWQNTVKLKPEHDDTTHRMDGKHGGQSVASYQFTI